jgi:hypothetical protein
MADFCSLCDYGDLNIEEIYNKHIKPDLLNDMKDLKDDEFINVGVGGVCEHCGITSIGINNKYEAWGGYYGESDHKFGCVDKETLELHRFEDDPKYNEQRESMKREIFVIELEQQIIKQYCLDNNKEVEKLVQEDFEAIDSIFKLKVRE